MDHRSINNTVFPESLVPSFPFLSSRLHRKNLRRRETEREISAWNVSLLLLSEDRGIESENLAVILEAVRFVEPVVETERKEEGGEDRKTEERKKKQSGSDGRFVRAAGVRLNENKPTSHITHWEVGEAHRLLSIPPSPPLNEPTNEEYK